jgi:hypothetical protein
MHSVRSYAQAPILPLLEACSTTVPQPAGSVINTKPIMSKSILRDEALPLHVATYVPEFIERKRLLWPQEM